MQPSSTDGRLFSIGHSNHDLLRLVELLRRAGVQAVADVRSQPFSRWLPQFNRHALAQGLRPHGIGYLFLGDALGGRPAESSVYDAEGRVDYERVRATAGFRQGIDRLLEVAERGKVAMLCSEEDPLDCHRALMIGPALIERGAAPAHLRGNGTIETTTALEERLLAETNVGAGILDGLFAFDVTTEERRQFLADAYRVMAGRKAFRLRAGDALPGFTDDPA
jgi:uncharacterized protein (DUF488 family)